MRKIILLSVSLIGCVLSAQPSRPPLTCADLRPLAGNYGDHLQGEVRGMPKEAPAKFECQDTPKGVHLGPPSKKAPNRRLPAARTGARGNA
jgi:hypothetical protein